MAEGWILEDIEAAGSDYGLEFFASNAPWCVPLPHHRTNIQLGLPSGRCLH